MYEGRIYDVAIDLRKDSPTYKEWASIELNEKINIYCGFLKDLVMDF